MRLARNVNDGNLPIEEEEQGNNGGAVATLGLLDGIKKFTNKDNMKALVSVEEACRLPLNDRASDGSCRRQCAVSEHVRHWSGQDMQYAVSKGIMAGTKKESSVQQRCAYNVEELRLATELSCGENFPP